MVGGKAIAGRAQVIGLVVNVLEEKNVNLRIMEREDLSIVKGWDNDVGIMGEYEPVVQETKADLERSMAN